MQPAARMFDFHMCPMVDPGPKPHVGGPIASAAATVRVEYLAAARVGDTATCTGPPDNILAGSGTVRIENQFAARMFDTTAHGGKILLGAATVRIG